MTASWDEQADPLRRPPEADAQEQQQEETVVGPADSVEEAVPEASEADLAEQGALAPPSDRTDLADAVRDDTNPADAVEQNLEIPVPDEDRRA